MILTILAIRPYSAGHDVIIFMDGGNWLIPSMIAGYFKPGGELHFSMRDIKYKDQNSGQMLEWPFDGELK